MNSSYYASQFSDGPPLECCSSENREQSL